MTISVISQLDHLLLMLKMMQRLALTEPTSHMRIRVRSIIQLQAWRLLIQMILRELMILQSLYR
nr:MAG TPA_asm: hypothetical protein [Caudoviricetes sp.]